MKKTLKISFNLFFYLVYFSITVYIDYYSVLVSHVQQTVRKSCTLHSGPLLLLQIPTWSRHPQSPVLVLVQSWSGTGCTAGGERWAREWSFSCIISWASLPVLSLPLHPTPSMEKLSFTKPVSGAQNIGDHWSVPMHSYQDIIDSIPYLCCNLYLCDYSVTINLYCLIPSPFHPAPPPLLPLTTASLFSISMSLFLFCLFCSLDSTCKWNHMVFVFLSLAYFT